VAEERRDSLDEGMARIRQAMDRAWRDPRHGMVDRDPREWKDAWQAQRRAYKEERRMRKHEGAGPRGAVFLGMAGVLTYFVFANGAPWWLLWVAFGLSLSGVGQLASSLGSGRKSKDATIQGEATPVADPTPDPANLKRVDALCDKLLEELRKGPEVLREVVRNPEASVKGLKDTIHGLATREAELRALVTNADGERLKGERVDVVARRDSATDPVTRERWDGALQALDAQLQHRETLRTQGARLEAERVRLGYTLENLYTQVLAVRSTAGSDAAGAQLKAGVERLGDEISAVADALESMQAVDPGPGGTDASRASPSSRTRT
jgi:hypothetical protein